MRILICDDENTYADELKSFIENYFLLRHLPVEITIKCNPIDIVNGNSAYEIAFLDIQMDNVDGLSLAKILKERNSKVAIFFITSFGRYQDDAMDLNAFCFFEKPFDPDRLCSGLDKVMEYIDRTYVDFFVYTNGIHKKIPADDILYVERDNRRSILHTLNETYSARESFDFWEKALQSTYFYTVHKSFIVNLHYVTKYDYSELYLQDSIRIPIAPRRQKDFRKFWFEYLRRR